MTDVAYFVAGLVEELGGERAAAHTGAIGLEDAIYLAYLAGSHTQTAACTGADGVAAGNKRIGAKVDVEHAALSSLTQHLLASFQLVVDVELAVDQVKLLEVVDACKPQLLGTGHIGLLAVDGLEELHVAGLGTLILRLEVVEDVAYAQTVAAHLVGVGGANAFSRCSYFALTFQLLVGGIEQPVGGQDEMSFFGNFQNFSDVDATFLKLLGFVHKEHRVEDNTVANHVHLVVLENA